MQIARFMAEQPDAIVDGYAAASEFLAGWQADGFGRVLLVGSGSSLNAAAFAAPILGGAFEGDVEVLGPLEFLARRQLDRVQATLVVVTSQTGTSTTSVEALRKAAEFGASTLLVTAAEGGPAARLGHPKVLLPVGEEPIGPKTKGFVASCAALVALAARLGTAIAPPDGLARSFQDALNAASDLAEALADQLDDLDYVLVAGYGASFGIALEASLKIAEIAGVPTAAFTLEEALHGRLHGLTGRSLCVFVVADDVDWQQATPAKHVIEALGIRVITVQSDTLAELAAPWGTLAATFFFQHLAVALCRRRGREPDLMRYPGLTSKLAIKLDDRP